MVHCTRVVASSVVRVSDGSEALFLRGTNKKKRERTARPVPIFHRDLGHAQIKKNYLIMIFYLLVGIDDFFNQTVAHNVFIVEINYADAVDVF